MNAYKIYRVCACRFSWRKNWAAIWGRSATARMPESDEYIQRSRD